MAKNLRKPKIGVKNPAAAALLLSFGCGVGVCILLLALAAFLLTHTVVSARSAAYGLYGGGSGGRLCPPAMLARRLQKRLLLCGLGCGAFYAVCLLAATLLIGACTPAMEIYRASATLPKRGLSAWKTRSPTPWRTAL